MWALRPPRRSMRTRLPRALRTTPAGSLRGSDSSLFFGDPRRTPRAAVPNRVPGDTIPLSAERALRVVELRSSTADDNPVLARRRRLKGSRFDPCASWRLHAMEPLSSETRQFSAAAVGRTEQHMRRITLAGLVAVVAVLLIAPAANAAPSMTVTDVFSPDRFLLRDQSGERSVGRVWTVTSGPTSARGTRRSASRRLTFDNGLEYGRDDAASANDDYRIWPWSIYRRRGGLGVGRLRCSPLRASTMSGRRGARPACSRTKTYLGGRPYRRAFTREKVGVVGVPASAAARSTPTRPASSLSTAGTAAAAGTPPGAFLSGARTASPRGGNIWSTAACRRSALHNLRAVRFRPKSVVLTETVSPGTMITVTDVDVKDLASLLAKGLQPREEDPPQPAGTRSKRARLPTRLPEGGGTGAVDSVCLRAPRRGGRRRRRQMLTVWRADR